MCSNKAKIPNKLGNMSSNLIISSIKMHNLKICIKCNLEKESNEFSQNLLKIDKLNNWCKNCTNLYVKNRAKENQKYVWNLLKEQCCVICKNTNPLVLEFDHLDLNTKLFNIKYMNRKSKKVLLDEISKCQILCKNCHRRKTHQQFNTWRWQRMNKL